MLIVEPKRGSEIKHVLCAESDEARDLWVEALLPWTHDMNSKEAKTTAHDRPSVSGFQTSSPQPSTFLLQVCDQSGQFRPVDHPGPHINISSAKIAGCSIDCRLNVSRTEFGTIEGLPGGIIYMDIAIGTPYRSLKSLTIMVVLHDKDPDLQRAAPVASANAFETLDIPVTLTEFYGPKTGVLRGRKVVEPQNPRFHPETEAFGRGLGAIGAVQDPTGSSGGYWKILSHLSQSKNSRLYRGVCWEIIPSDMDATSVHARPPIHTGFVFQGGGQAFSLSVGINGKSSKVADRLVARANRNASKWGKILLNCSNGHLYRPLDELARALPDGMNFENGLQATREVSDAGSNRRTSTGATTPSSSVQSLQYLQPTLSSKAEKLVDQSPGQNIGDRGNQKRTDRALETSSIESGDNRPEEDFQGLSNDDPVHEGSYAGKEPIRHSKLRSGEQALRSMIPWLARRKTEDKPSELAPYFGQLSHELERQRSLQHELRLTRTAKIQNPREFLPRTPAKATIEVYADADQAESEPGPSYHDHSEADGDTFSQNEGGPVTKDNTSTLTLTDTMKNSVRFFQNSGPRDTDTAPKGISSPQMRRASQRVAARLYSVKPFKTQQDESRD